MTEEQLMEGFRKMVEHVGKGCRRGVLMNAALRGDVKRENGAVRILATCRATKRMKQNIFVYPKGIEEGEKHEATAAEVECTMEHGLCSMCPLREG